MVEMSISPLSTYNNVLFKDFSFKHKNWSQFTLSIAKGPSFYTRNFDRGGGTAL